MNSKTATFFVLVMSLVVTSCGQGQQLKPTFTPTPTQVSKPTMTPAPTIIPTITVSPIPIVSHIPDPEAVKLTEEAFSYSQQGEDEKAIETYTKAIEVDPLYGQPYFNRGSIYAHHRELEKALADFNKGLEVDPTNLLGYSNRAQVYIELDKLNNALEDIKLLLNLTNDDAYVINALTIGGHIYEIQGKPFLAITAYSAALERDEFFVPALLNRGQTYFNNQDWLRAFSDLSLVLEISDNPELRDAAVTILTRVYPEGTTLEEAMAAAKVYFDQGVALREKGDYAGSTEAITKAIEIDPLNSDFYFIRGLNFANDGKLEEGIADMSFSIALLPSDPRGYYYRGLMESDLGLAAESIADLEKTLEFDVNSDAKANADRVLKDMRQLYKSCQFTMFEAVNDAAKPTFEFIFTGPPNTDFVISIFNHIPGGDGSIMFAVTPQDGITPTGIEYELKDGETTPIELDIKIRAGNCQLRQTPIWPEIDILALLSGANP